MRLRVGFIGCGRILEMHGNAIGRMSDVEVVAVCDIVESRAIEASKLYGGKVYTDYLDLFANESMDLVHLCLPHNLHSIVGIIAAQHGVHVLTEKPLDVSYERAKLLVDACDDAGVKLGVIFQNRYRKTNVQMFDMIRSGDFGKVLGARMSLSWLRTEEYYHSTKWKGFWATEGGGVIIDQAIHTLDFINWVLGGDIKSVDAYIANRHHPSIEVEDIAEGVILYKEGFQFSFHAFNYYSYDAEVMAEIQTEKATFRMIGSLLEIISNNGEVVRVDISLDDVLENQSANKAYWGTTHFEQIDEFYSYVRGDSESIGVDGHEALKTQGLVEAIYRAGKSGKTVKIS